jgi:hypothetical protein
MVTNSLQLGKYSKYSGIVCGSHSVGIWKPRVKLGRRKHSGQSSNER